MSNTNTYDVQIERPFFLSCMIAVAVFGVFVLFDFLPQLLMPLLALACSAVCKPLVNFLQDKKIPRFISIYLLYALIICTVIIAQIFIIPQLVENIVSLISSVDLGLLSQYITENTPFTLNIQESLVPHVHHIPDYIIANTGNISISIGKILVNIVLFFTVLHWNLIHREYNILKSIKTVIPENVVEHFEKTQDIVTYVFQHWLKGQSFMALIMSICVFIGATLLGLEFALALACIAFIVEFIPYIGVFIIALFALPEIVPMGIIPSVIAIGGYWALNWSKENILTPIVMKKNIDIHPILVILALITAGTIGGFWGLLFAVPITGIIKNVVVMLIEKQKIDRKTIS